MEEWMLPEYVVLREIVPRDGLQFESKRLSTPRKIELINRLANSGVSRIEAASFVSPRWVPQMADAEAVMKGIERKPGVIYSVLTPNPYGAERALETRPDEITVVISASETHNYKNVNRTISESLQNLSKICDMARPEGVIVSAVIAAAFGCPYEGRVSESTVVDLAFRLQNMGIVEVTLGDTIGVANPLQVTKVVETVRMNVPMLHLGAHFHDTRGLALANMIAALSAGITRFDTALGGIGGSPFSRDMAGGNLATEEAMYCLEEMGIATGIELSELLATTQYLTQCLGHSVPSKVFRAGGRMVPANK